MHSLARRSSALTLTGVLFLRGHPANAQVPEEDGRTRAPDGEAPEVVPAWTLDEDRVLPAESEEDAYPAASAGAPVPPEAGSSPARATVDDAKAPVAFGGYVEAFYQWNFDDPSNGISNFRGFDNRHNTFTLSNVALDAAWDHEGLVGRLTLQIGHTPSTYYLSEPGSPGANGANASDAELWKYVQQAYAGYRFGLGGGLTVTAGLFLSPIGPESMAVRDNWNWSNSNLFFGLPFYHTGVRASYALTDEWAVTVAGYNGWNSVVDNNDEKSVSVQLNLERPDVSASLLYFGVVERLRGATEGRAWRHLLDSHVTWHATERLSLRAHSNGGIEPNAFGASAWAAGALYARYRIFAPLFCAVRGDVFLEHLGESAVGRASAIFWPAPWVASGTATLDYRPHERVSFRLELRHDHAGADLYFGGSVVGDGAVTPFVANRVSQDTLTLGATTVF